MTGALRNPSLPRRLRFGRVDLQLLGGVLFGAGATTVDPLVGWERHVALWGGLALIALTMRHDARQEDAWLAAGGGEDE